MNTEQLAQQIAEDELGIKPEGGEWTSDGSDSFWCPDYTEEESEKVSRIEQHIDNFLQQVEWKNVANTESVVNYEVGDKVKFLDDLERYPHTTIPKDATGTIADIDELFVCVTIHDEDCAKDLAEWDGQLYLSNTPVTDFDKHEYEGLDSIKKVK